MSRVIVGLILLMAALTTGFAQDGNAPGDVRTRQDASYGTYLVDAQGRSLYLFTNDGANTSTCSGDCIENWPPFSVEGEPVAGEGVAGSLLATITRADGARQVTYAGHALYTFSQDQAPGDTLGHGVNAFGAGWYLVSPYGVAIEAGDVAGGGAAAAGDGEQGEQGDEQGAAAIPQDQFMDVGQSLFAANCAVCHGEQGEGFTGPKLAGNDKLRGKGLVIGQIQAGGRGMPRFGDTLSDAEIAAVATFIRGSWGNQFGVITQEEVANYGR